MKAKDEYFDWLVDKIDDGRADLYSVLLNHLYETAFFWTVDNDGNREADGFELRERYAAEEIPFDLVDICSEIGPKECSVLEVIIALACRMEDILYDPDFGNRIPEWFWLMIDNLGLLNMVDRAFNTSVFNEIMDIFLFRKYDKDGFGGLFRIKNRQIDMRKTEIWYQMMYFLDEIT